jgi:hypothetical protein
VVPSRPATVEDREFPVFVGIRKHRTHFLNIGKFPLFHFPVPVAQTGFTFGMDFRKVVNWFAGNDTHLVEGTGRVPKGA